ncbi:hypothetical protein LOTGIDRAFT_233346 [Lottia gigantea]|uniref:Uncharacterized protein n=1 Tax=Lottia gigantea TaxID=225164 RepID=V4A9K7_LOTGI|nr:hypothetical protein LOTGIDRAFT_233346 [Lottia gigantea]ESO91760.1 hypothetical protein LOTGIDRAFT_233346 [Lottia gigantea]
MYYEDLYNYKIRIAIREALSCFKTAIDGCDDYKDPFAGKTESFLTLRDHLQNYCSDAGAAASSCADFTTCFTEVNLPQAANDLVDPMYWCAVGQAAASCSAKLTSESDECKTVKKYGEIKTELDKTCPSPVDVLNGVFGAKDSGVDAGRYNIMVIMVASLVTIKMVY